MEDQLIYMDWAIPHVPLIMKGVMLHGGKFVECDGAEDMTGVASFIMSRQDAPHEKNIEYPVDRSKSGLATGMGHLGRLNLFVHRDRFTMGLNRDTVSNFRFMKDGKPAQIAEWDDKNIFYPIKASWEDGTVKQFSATGYESFCDKKPAVIILKQW